jgi:hypothetical protein
MPRMTNAMRTAPPPPAAPATRATLLCDELLDVLPDVLPDGLLDGLLELDDGEAVDVADVPEVDDGELAFKHEESLDCET